MSQAVLNLIAKKALKDVAGKKDFNHKVRRVSACVIHKLCYPMSFADDGNQTLTSYSSHRILSSSRSLSWTRGDSRRGRSRR